MIRTNKIWRKIIIGWWLGVQKSPFLWCFHQKVYLEFLIFLVFFSYPKRRTNALERIIFFRKNALISIGQCPGGGVFPPNICTPRPEPMFLVVNLLCKKPLFWYYVPPLLICHHSTCTPVSLSRRFIVELICRKKDEFTELIEPMITCLWMCARLGVNTLRRRPLPSGTIL